MNLKTVRKKVKKVAAFTLIELIIVIAIIGLLAAVVLVAINPQATFQKARNAQRANDVQTIGNAITKFLAEASTSGTGRSLYTTATVIGANVAIGNSGTVATPNTTGLISGPGASANGAYAASPRACVNGSNATGAANLIAPNGFQILATGAGSALTVDLQNLITQSYLGTVPTDPSAGTNYYYMCIDTAVPSSPVTTNSNPGRLVIYAPNVEAGVAVPSFVI